MRIMMIRQTSNYAFSQLGNGIGIIATILDKAGHTVKVIDNNSQYKHYSNRDLIKIAKTFRPDAIAFSISIPNTFETYKLVEEMHTSFPDLLIIAGGIHMRRSYEEALQKGIDIVVNRDGEKVVLPLFDHIKSKCRSNYRESLEKVPGISYLREDGSIYVSDNFPTLESLNDVPIVNYNLFNIKDYIKTGKEPGLFFITAQRGCPFTCTFCSDDLQRSDKRAASGEWIFRNVENIYNNYKSHYIVIADNNFTFPRQRAVDFCNRMIQSGLNNNISFSCQTKVETPLDDELLSLMKKAGFKKVNIGLERLDPYSLKMIKKKSSFNRVHKVMSAIKNAGLEIGIFILVGFPFDTEDILKKERESFLSLLEYTRTFNCSILQPTPGTEYYNNYPKSHEWYLDKKAFHLQRSYFANILEAYMIGQVDQNFFNLPKNVQKQIKNFYLEFKQINLGSFASRKSFMLTIGLKFDLLMAKLSQIIFKISPCFEFQLFNKIRFVRYYLGTFLFGRIV